MSKLVVIDPGHGGSDPGAGGHGLKEAAVALRISRRIRTALLQDFDVDVKLTRSDDRFVELADRAKFANDRNAAFFVAVHINSGGGTGYEDFVHPEAGERTKRLRSEVHRSIGAFLQREGVVNRGRKTANFAVLRLTDMPAVLTENLFIDRQSDAARLDSESFLQGIAEAHARGIAKALNLPRVASPVS